MAGVWSWDVVFVPAAGAAEEADAPLVRKRVWFGSEGSGELCLVPRAVALVGEVLIRCGLRGCGALVRKIRPHQTLPEPTLAGL